MIPIEFVVIAGCVVGAIAGFFVGRKNGSTIITGNSYVAYDSVHMVGGRLIIDGEEVTGESYLQNVIHIDVKGNSISVDSDKSVSVSGDVTGNIDARGSVTCDNVHGDIKAGGSVTCDDVKGSIYSNSSVTCNNVGGSVMANGSISHV